MPDLIVISTAELIGDFDADENPAETFPCLPCGPLVRDERAGLYAILSGLMFDDAIGQEALVHALAESGPFVYQLQDNVLADVAAIEEDDIDDIAEEWYDSAGVAELGFEVADLAQFLYQFVHFCRTAQDELGIFIFSDN